MCLNLSIVKGRAHLADKITWKTTEVAGEADALCFASFPVRIKLQFVFYKTIAQYSQKFKYFSQQHTGKTILLMKMVNVHKLVREKHKKQSYR